MKNGLNVLLVDDDWAVREALNGFLSKRGMQVWQADSRAAVATTADPTVFDVAVLDIVIPEHSGERANFDEHVGVDLARELHQRNPRIGIVFLSAYMDRGPEVVQLFMEGHDRIVYLLKASEPKELLNAIHKVTRSASGLEIASGIGKQKTSLFETALSTLTPEERDALQQALPRLSLLTKPEWAVLEALGNCLTRRSAASRIGVVIKTVDYHINCIYEKLLLRESNLSQTALLTKLYLLHSLQKITPSG